MADEPIKDEPTAPAKREPKDIASDLTNKAVEIRGAWNTNADHPDAIVALNIASLLEEAADVLTPKKPAKP